MANLIPIGTAATDFGDGEIVVTTPTAMRIIDAGDGLPLSSGPVYEFAQKNSAGDYNIVAVLNTSNIMSMGGIAFPGTYAVRRVENGWSSGFDVEQ